MRRGLGAAVLGWVAGIGACVAAVSPALGYDPVGRWRVSTGESQYQVTLCQRDRLCARLVWLRDDLKATKAAESLNQYVVTEAVEVQPDEWRGTLRYNGGVYEGRLLVEDERHMSLRGCKGVLCQTFRLVRVNPTGR